MAASLEGHRLSRLGWFLSGKGGRPLRDALVEPSLLDKLTESLLQAQVDGPADLGAADFAQAMPFGQAGRSGSSLTLST
jgi:hypothetical protein